MLLSWSGSTTSQMAELNQGSTEKEDLLSPQYLLLLLHPPGHMMPVLSSRWLSPILNLVLNWISSFPGDALVRAVVFCQTGEFGHSKKGASVSTNWTIVQLWPGVEREVAEDLPPSQLWAAQLGHPPWLKPSLWFYHFRKDLSET